MANNEMLIMVIAVVVIYLDVERDMDF